MTNTINAATLRIIYDNLSAEARATILFTLDTELRNNISDEEVFERWLMCGVPDGCMTAEHVQETMNTEYMEWEEFEEYILLAASCFEMDNEELE
jgi:hypothetical protein